MRDFRDGYRLCSLRRMKLLQLKVTKLLAQAVSTDARLVTTTECRVPYVTQVTCVTFLVVCLNL